MCSKCKVRQIAKTLVKRVCVVESKKGMSRRLIRWRYSVKEKVSSPSPPICFLFACVFRPKWIIKSEVLYCRQSVRSIAIRVFNYNGPYFVRYKRGPKRHEYTIVSDRTKTDFALTPSLEFRRSSALPRGQRMTVFESSPVRFNIGRMVHYHITR